MHTTNTAEVPPSAPTVSKTLWLSTSAMIPGDRPPRLHKNCGRMVALAKMHTSDMEGASTAGTILWSSSSATSSRCLCGGCPQHERHARLRPSSSATSSRHVCGHEYRRQGPPRLHENRGRAAPLARMYTSNATGAPTVGGNLRPSSSATSSRRICSSDNTYILDGRKDKGHAMCGYGPVAFVASIKSLKCLPHELTSSGRFDLHVQVPGLSVPARIEILRQTIGKLHLLCSTEIVSDIASKCDGYDAYDLEIMVYKAVLSASDRFLGSSGVNLLEEDFLKAMMDFSPVAMRDISKFSPESSSGWEDVGGLPEVVNVIKENIELPLKYPKFFAGAPVRLRSNILLYGPTGCGKTHVVRDAFAKASAAAPCLLFFDEFESLVPQRGKHGTQVTDRVVNQFLTELDGVEALTGVFVFAATNKPREIDAALLRPGRFDRLVFCDFPQWNERLDILRVLSKELPLASDTDLEPVASMTEGFSGADLKAILTDAGLQAAKEAVQRHSREASSSTPRELPLITRGTLMSVASEARPSTSEEERRSLRGMFNQFSTSRKSSISTQRREANGQSQRVAVAES